MDALAYIAERSPWADAALDALLPPSDAAPAALHSAMRHLVFPGGKVDAGDSHVRRRCTGVDDADDPQVERCFHVSCVPWRPVLPPFLRST